jgi:hypothetical protein
MFRSPSLLGNQIITSLDSIGTPEQDAAHFQFLVVHLEPVKPLISQTRGIRGRRMHRPLNQIQMYSASRISPAAPAAEFSCSMHR